MTFGGVRDYFRTRLDGLSFREWTDGFNTANIPSTILDRSYHLEVGRIIGSPANQHSHIYNYPLTVTLFFKGFRDPGEAIDEALDQAYEVTADILQTSVRLQTAGLKDIRPVSISNEPLAGSNDNGIIVKLVFDVYLLYCF